MDELIANFLSKGTTPDEEERLLKWITSDDENRKYYSRMYRVWLRSAMFGQPDVEKTEKALKQFHEKAFELSIATNKPQAIKTKKGTLLTMLKYAAVIALLIVSTYTLTRHFMTQPVVLAVAEMTYEVQYGSRAYATLPDGSKMWLNSGSKLIIKPEYNLHERTVELVGEAFFDVETNPEKPFIVKVGEISITATGTTFNVKAYPEEEHITTTLVEGVVFIENNKALENKFKVQLKPNQTVSYNRQERSLNNITNETVIEPSTPSKPAKSATIQTPLTASLSQQKTTTLTSWMKDRWVIDNLEFGQLAVQLERRYNVDIIFNSEELMKYRFTGTIERETVEQMFELFRYSIPLRYTIDKGIITLSLDNELKKQYENAWKR